MRLLLVTLAFLSAPFFLVHAAASPVYGSASNLTGTVRVHGRDGKPLLRLMPLGASITQGYVAGVAENLHSGYRKPLREELRYRGYAVNMVGSRSHGDFTDNQHEGWPGLEVEGVASNMIPVMTAQKPNLVSILLGTNDCMHARRDENLDYARSVKDRMRTLIWQIYSSSPGVTVILATLPPTTDSSNEPYIQAANAGYRELVSELQGQGQKIELAEMYTKWFEAGDHSDSLHFTDAGYAKMAAIFAQAFSRVEAKGWITSPPVTGIPDSAGCLPSPDGFRGPIQTQLGNGYDDGDGMRFCDMYGRGYDDYLWVSTDGNVHLFENLQNPPQWTNHGRILESNRNRKFIDVGDWDGDGHCDILAVDRKTGNVDMFRNTYKQGAAFPTFDAPVQVVNNALCPQPHTNGELFDIAVRFGDLDGDGRVDYICMYPNGRSAGWLNKPNELQTMPSTIPNQIKVSEGFDRAQHRWADVNGDGKVDLIAINPSTGAIDVWMNRGIQPALTSGMSWDRHSNAWMTGVQTGVIVHFPRLSRSRRADYHVVKPQTNAAETWFNEGRCGGGAGDDGEVRNPELPEVRMVV